MIRKTLKKSQIIAIRLTKLLTQGFLPKSKKRKYIKSIVFQKGVTIIRLRGDFTVDNLDFVQNEFTERTKGKNLKNILFDLEEVSDADSSSVALLIDLFRLMQEQEKAVRIGLINVSKKIKSLLTISRTAALFKEYRSEISAINDLTR